MGFFRRSDEPTDRETFLVSALTEAGLTAAQIADAQAAKATGFLKDLDKSTALATAISERDAALASASALTAALTGSGFTIEQAQSADSLKAAVQSRIDTAAAAKAAEISASRGIQPVKEAPKEEQDAKAQEMKRADFEALDHAKRNAFMKNGGKIVD